MPTDMAIVVLIIGASGTVGSKVVKDLADNQHQTDHDVRIRLSTSQSKTAEKWRKEGHDAVVLDLNAPDTFEEALQGVDRVFLLTGYTADMLYQSKMLIDAAVAGGRISHLVHLGVFSSGRDHIPHFAWHDLIESYIQSSGIAWTHLHPNVILDSLLITQPPLSETKSFTVMWGDASLGWISAFDIAAVAAQVLREGPGLHGGKTYGLSPEVFTGSKAAETLSQALGTEISCNIGSSKDLAGYVNSIPDAGTRLYMQSAVQTMRQGETGKMRYQSEVRDDVKTVLGRPALTLREWACRYLGGDSI